MKTAVLAFSAALFAPGAYSWGLVGHATVGYVAQHYLDGAAKILTSHLLDGVPLANVASWADSFRYTDAGAFSAHLHYIDAHDQVPNKCGVKLERDCPPEGCIVTAIANYWIEVLTGRPVTQTSRILDDKLSKEERANALKFVVHFLGDITQPLHTENLDVGGNTITVTWGGNDAASKTNLHAVWDTKIVETLAGGSTLAAADTLSKSIITDIESGIYKDQKESWTSCGSIKRGTGCPKAWAQDANQFVCTNVLVDGADAVRGQDVSGAYYEKNVPIARQQLAKGGYRLGLWLNAIAKAEQKKC
ncbi:hypothetical protein Dda_5217 [Drechslerella dactyloides]|uniref:Nuclease S1 n=1 Tax=Drechslerella dactyloides TaxID=74499 RepID=A0AAD6IX53_DREDA|nr:hypothetical protein Dda_5217 [Drechslerella dactyloides]